MLRYLLGLLGRLRPQSSGAKFLNRLQYRALKSTWPVAFSIVFLGGLFLVSDQGRAILKFTASDAAFNVRTYFIVGLFVFQGLILMYAAFQLSAVTRRAYLDEDQSRIEELTTPPLDPVDSSIELRHRYAYFSGLFLPFQFMVMCIWFDYDFVGDPFNPIFLTGVATGIGIGGAIWLLAVSLYHPAARKFSQFNAPQAQPDLLRIANYRLWSVILYMTDPASRLAQSVFSGLAAAISFWSFKSDTTYLPGACVFLAVVLLLHFSYRLAKDKVVRLHHGHAARYIVLDPGIERGFNVFRWGLIFAIPASLWQFQVYHFLGPLGVGVLGALWVTLFFSVLVESAARYSIAEVKRKRLRTRAVRGLDQNQANRSLGEDGWLSWFRLLTLKTWFFIVLIVLLAIELIVSVSEALRFDQGFSWDFVFLTALVGIIAFSLHRLFDETKRGAFAVSLNKLPSSIVVTPIIFLSLGEAHHIHRYELGGAIPQDAVTLTKEEPFPNMENHVDAWIDARSDHKGEIPAIIILAEGGGIRAAAHTGYYLSQLDEALREHCQKNREHELCVRQENTRLVDNVFLISGVSGGAIGASAYLAALAEENRWALEPLVQGQFSTESQTVPSPRDSLIRETLGADYLSPLFAGLFGSDLLTTVVPAQLPDRFYGLIEKDKTEAPWTTRDRGIVDRADFFEKRLAANFDRALSDVLNAHTLKEPTRCARSFSEDKLTFDRPLENVVSCAAEQDDRYDPGPIVFFSTFYETGGYQMATSNIDIGGDSEAPLNCGRVPIVQQMLGSEEPVTRSDTNCDTRKQTLPLSTAAHLSARFPGSNPTGVIETRYANGRWKRHFFVDGGYLDNSGAHAALQAIDMLRQSLKNRKKSEPVKVSVKVINLFALTIPPPSTSEEEVIGRSPKATKQSEFTTIPSALLKARNIAGRAPLEMLCRDLTKNDPIAHTKCDVVFDRRTVEYKDLIEKFTPEHFKERYCEIESENCVPRLMDPCRLEMIALTDRNTSEDFVREGEIASSAWLPMPLELARSDRQENAVVALLGWTLMSETTEQIITSGRAAAPRTLSALLGRKQSACIAARGL